MSEIITVGLDLAKNVFQAHGADASGPMDAKKMTLEKLIDRTGARAIQYVYDFGDDWDHSIRIERVNEDAQA